LKHLAWAITLRPTRHHFTHPHPHHALTVPVHYYYYYPTGNIHTHIHTYIYIYYKLSLLHTQTHSHKEIHAYMIPFTRVLQLHVYSEYIIQQQSYRELDNLTREKHPHTHIRTRINIYTDTHTHTLNISDDDLSPLHYLRRRRRRRGHRDGRTRWKRPCVIIPFGKTHWKLHSLLLYEEQNVC